MKTQLFIISAMTLIFFSACNKESEKKFSISGRILEDCSQQSYATKEIFFFQRIGNDWALQTSGGDLGSTTTDANGNFTFSYKPKNNNDIRIQAAAGFGFNPLIENIPTGADVKDLLVFRNPRYRLQVSLNVATPRSAGDTLFITDYSGIYYLKFPCPLANGVLYTNTNATKSPLQLNNNNLLVNWYFKSNPSMKYNKTVPIKNFCGSDTTKVLLDIN